MSEAPIQKLNLKALKPIDVEKAPSISDQDSISTDALSSITTSTETHENKKSVDAASIESNAKEDPKPLKISFSDIKKEIPKVEAPISDTPETPKDTKTIKNLEEKEEIQENQKPEITSPIKKQEPGNISDKKIVSNMVEVQDNTQTLDSQEEKISHEEIAKDTDPLENTNNTDQIVATKQEKKKIQKRGIFWFLKKNKKDQKISANSDNGETLTSEKQDISDIQAKTSENTDIWTEEEIHFDNYESHFKKESSNLLNRFKTFKYTPQTRVWLILGLISITVFAIGSLMLVFPEKHSPQIYKASILQIIWKTPVKEEHKTPRPIPQNTQEKEDPITENNQTENTNTTPPSEIEKKQDSREKLRQHLLKKYN